MHPAFGLRLRQFPTPGLLIKQRAMFPMVLECSQGYLGPQGGIPDTQPVKALVNLPELRFIRVCFKST